MEAEKKNTFFTHNTLFGIFVGLSFVVTSYIFFKTGREISLNPQLNNVIMLLSIVGIFFGVRMYRDQQCGGYISYKKALAASIWLLAVAAVLYGIYLYTLYNKFPELKENYLGVIEAALQEHYSGSPLLENMNTMFKAFTTPATIALGEVFNKLFTGAIFSLFIAGILRRNSGLQP